MKWTCLPLLALSAAVLGGLMTGCGAKAPAPEPSPSPVPTPLQPAPKILTATVASPTAPPASDGSDMLLIFDDDGSRDGMAAMLYLLETPGFDLQAITISYGEAHPARYVQHVGRVLDRLGAGGIPLGAGQDAPLAGGTAFPDWLREMSDSFWGYPLPGPPQTYPFQSAPDLIASTLRQADSPMTIFVSGPFTNLAQALRLDPAIRDRISAVYFMGGAVGAPGNITNLLPDSGNAVAEWNILADPQAAREVFDSGLPLFMIPLDATNRIALRQADISRWRSGGEAANLVADMYDIMFDDFGFESVEVFDLTAAALMASPGLCTFQPVHLDVVVEDGDSLGQTVIVPGAPPNIGACLEPDVDLTRDALDRTFAGTASPPAGDFPTELAGTWQGSAFNKGFELQVTLVIEVPCDPGQVCGRFDIPVASCSGTLAWLGMEGQLYRFEAGNKTQGCGSGADYLSPQDDGTLVYISRGDYGETRGVLHRLP